MQLKALNCIPARISLALLCATGVMELYMTRSNFSIAIVAMVHIVKTGNSSQSASIIPFCLRDSSTNGTDNDTRKNENVTNSAPIQMTTFERGNVMSAFFYAYGLSAIIGGRLSEVYGTKIIFGIGVMVDAIGNFLIPEVAKYNSNLLFCLRFAMGFFQGACYPSLHSLTSRWIPQNEANRFVAFVYNSNSFGTIFTLTVCGVIISSIGWEAVFYTCGCLSLLWFVFWILLMHDLPEKHPRISNQEREMILKTRSMENTSKKRKVPWISMLLSVPLWAIHIAHSGSMLGLTFYLTTIPIYMSDVIGVNIKNNGWLSSLPFLARYIGSNVFSWLDIFLKNKFDMNLRTLRIFSTIISFGGPAICVALIGYVGCNMAAVTSLMVVGNFLNGATSTSYVTNHIDIAPNFAGTALGMSSFIAFLYAMIGPVVVGVITENQNINEWIIVYWLLFGNYVISGGFYIIFMSTKVQQWNDEISQEWNRNKIFSVAPSAHKIQVASSSSNSDLQDWKEHKVTAVLKSAQKPKNIITEQNTEIDEWRQSEMLPVESNSQIFQIANIESDNTVSTIPISAHQIQVLTRKKNIDVYDKDL